LCGTFPGQYSQAAPATGWRLEQQSDYSGRQTMIVSPAGIRADSLDYATIIVPPDYKAALYNHRTRLCYLSTAKKLAEKYRLKPEAVYQVVRGGSQKIAGLQATQYFGDKRSAAKISRRKLEFWVTQDLAVPQKAYAYWAALSGIPSGYGLPLRVIKYQKGGRRTLILDTVSCRQVQITPDTFKGVAGYRPVDDEMSLILGE
jgi:hypothetical protein